jgi:molybdate/tungstate transport system substrate-binding protein
MPRLLSSLVSLALVAIPFAAPAEGTVNVLYAGSLVNLMEHSIGPAFAKTSGEQFRGYAGAPTNSQMKLRAGSGKAMSS